MSRCLCHLENPCPRTVGAIMKNRHWTIQHACGLEEDGEMGWRDVSGLLTNKEAQVEKARLEKANPGQEYRID